MRRVPERRVRALVAGHRRSARRARSEPFSKHIGERESEARLQARGTDGAEHALRAVRLRAQPKLAREVRELRRCAHGAIVSTLEQSQHCRVVHAQRKARRRAAHRLGTHLARRVDRVERRRTAREERELVARRKRAHVTRRERFE